MGLYIIGVLLFLMGSICILQGVGLYPVGGMAYQVQWAYIGIVMDLVGIGLIVLASRRRKNLPPSSKALDPMMRNFQSGVASAVRRFE